MASAVPERNERREKEAKVQVKLRRQNTTAEKGRKGSGDKRRSSMFARWFKHLSEGTSGEGRQKKQKSDDGTSSLSPRPLSMLVPDTSSHLDTDTSKHKDDNKSQSNLYSKPSKSQSLDGLEKLDHVEVHSVVEPPLADPKEVVAQSVVVNTAPPVQSPHERLKEKDGVVSRALQDKRLILAEIYNIPADDFSTISDMAVEVEGEKEPREILLACFHQTEQLTSLVNGSLSVSSPGDDVGMIQSPASGDSGVDLPLTGGDGKSSDNVGDKTRTLIVDEAGPQSGEAGPPTVSDKAGDDGHYDDVDSAVSGGSSRDGSAADKKLRDFCVSIPSGKLLAITSKLKAQLHHLMEALAVREKEEERLQQELKSAQEQITSLLSSQKSQSAADATSPTSRPDSYISITSSTSEVGEVSETRQVHIESTKLVISTSTSTKVTMPNTDGMADTETSPDQDKAVTTSELKKEKQWRLKDFIEDSSGTEEDGMEHQRDLGKCAGEIICEPKEEIEESTKLTVEEVHEESTERGQVSDGEMTADTPVKKNEEDEDGAADGDEEDETKDRDDEDDDEDEMNDDDDDGDAAKSDDDSEEEEEDDDDDVEDNFVDAEEVIPEMVSKDETCSNTDLITDVVGESDPVSLDLQSSGSPEESADVKDSLDEPGISTTDEKATCDELNADDKGDEAPPSASENV